MSGRWVAAGLNAYGTPLRLDAEPRYPTPELAQDAADARACALALEGWEVVRRPDGSWRLPPVEGEAPPIERIVVFEAAGPQTTFPSPPAADSSCLRSLPAEAARQVQGRSAADSADGATVQVVDLIAPHGGVNGDDGPRCRYHEELDAIAAALRQGGRVYVHGRSHLLRSGDRCGRVDRPEAGGRGCASDGT